MLKDLSRFTIDNIDPLSDKDIDAIRSQYPEVPQDYLNFLKELGAGIYFDGCFDIHNGLSKAEDVCSDESTMQPKLKNGNALVFGLFDDSCYFFIPSEN